MSINVKWGRERLQIPLPPPDTKLSVLRQSLSEHTRLPPRAFKLIYAGAVMKDDNAPLSTYNLRSGGTLLLLESSPAASPPAVAASKPPKTEASTIENIRAEVAAVRNTLEPGVDAFLRTPTVDSEHTRLGELLLQALLRLDAIAIDSAWLEARRERKGAVRTVQGVLDRLDNGWREAKEQAQIQTRAGSQR
ncbi:hypothetical protein EDB92DRAFT_1794582 [Lactarius akahatsu]|uniref:BAG domain-containing protein n=1 Tax=Lactarius akahatsu TaxID=416441 RepID=A0AAD4LLY2_9AGAM|nr:hypothetical protein EDB92DRAFT_1794582 [Lactarius akahatsu]